MNERDDTGWFDYTFGMNDDNGRLIQIIIPARTEDAARKVVRKMLFGEKYLDGISRHFWLNDCQPYR